MRILRILFRIIIAIVLFGALVALVTLRTVDYTPYQETEYYQHTRQNLQTETQRLAAPAAGPLHLGTGKAGITPPIGVPLAGYGARKGAPSVGVHDSLFVRVIALQRDEKPLLLIGYDALILNPPVARNLEAKAAAAFGLEPWQLYFTATHTHSGPGGWGKGWVEEQFAGKPDSTVIRILIDSTLAAIGRAMDTLVPVEFGYDIVRAPAFVRNRLVGEKGTVDPELVFVAFRNDQRIVALFATYSAHATVLSSKNMSFSGDYPGYFERRLEDAIAGPAIFAAAGLGSHSPRGKGEGFEKARYIGEALADSVLAHLKRLDFQTETSLAALRIPVALPSLQIKLSNRVRLAPWLARKIFHVHPAYLHVLSLGNLFIFGSPGEISGELVLRVKERARSHGKEVTVTSFNGCYIGYVTPSEYYHLATYETKLMSWFGPYTGDYLVEIMNECMERISP